MKRKRQRRSAVGQAFVLGLAAGLILFAGWGFSHATRAERAYTPNNLMKTQPDSIPANTIYSYSPAETIRLHIPANSDEERDQSVKEEVRDALMASFGEQLSGLSHVKDAEKILESALPDIRTLAEACLKENGVSYGVEAAVKTVYFPDKTYELATGELIYLPQGEYKALQVVLGKGQGRNWWCVMYPPLCYFDLVQRGVVPSVPVSGVRSESESQSQQSVMLVDESLTEDVRVEVRSMVLDAIKAGMDRIGEALSFLAESGEGRAPTHDME